MANPLVIGLDLGTTTSKAVLLDPAGKVVASASGRVETLLPRPGWVEQDPKAFWSVVADTVKRAVAQVSAGDVAGVCLSGAMHSLMPVGRDHRPLAHAMTWADERALGTFAQLELGSAQRQELYQRTGCPVEALYNIARLRWWQESGGQGASDTIRFVALRDWAAFCLTGEWKTDHGLASTTGLLDIRRMVWDAEALELAGVTSPDPELPALVAPGQTIGRVTADAAKATNLLEGTPVLAGGSDGGMANLGAAGSAPGAVVVTTGTSGAVRLSTDQPRLPRGGQTWCYVVLPDRWIAGGAINNGGLAAQWVHDRFYGAASGGDGFTLMMKEAGAIEPGAAGLLAMPYFAGERSPWWRPDARAAFAGLAMHHTRAHLARATLEGVAFCLADVWDATGLTPEEAKSVRLTGGIVHSPVWCQILADVLNTTIVASEAADASAVGAALLGQVGLGIKPPAALVQAPKYPSKSFAPDAARHTAYARIRERFSHAARDLVFTQRP